MTGRFERNERLNASVLGAAAGCLVAVIVVGLCSLVAYFMGAF